MQISSISRSGWCSGIAQTSGPNRSRRVRCATGGQEHARRGRHAERRRMVLGEMIGVEARAIVGLGNPQAVLVVVRERAAVAVEMIEDAEFHYPLNDPRWRGYRPRSSRSAPCRARRARAASALAVEHRIDETVAVLRAQPAQVEGHAAAGVAQPLAVAGRAVVGIDALARFDLLGIGRGLAATDQARRVRGRMREQPYARPCDAWSICFIRRCACREIRERRGRRWPARCGPESLLEQLERPQRSRRPERWRDWDRRRAST